MAKVIKKEPTKWYRWDEQFTKIEELNGVSEELNRVVVDHPVHGLIRVEKDAGGYWNSGRRLSKSRAELIRLRLERLTKVAEDEAESLDRERSSITKSEKSAKEAAAALAKFKKLFVK